MEQVVQIIESVGFPIALAVASCYVFYKTQQQMREDYNKREEKMFQQLAEFSKTLNDFNETLIKIDSRLAQLEQKMEG